MDCYERPIRPNELMHYGILGMRWGVRRYQNPDGTLTSLGKKRNKKVSEKIQSTRNESFVRKKMEDGTYSPKYGMKMLRKTKDEDFKSHIYSLADLHDLKIEKGSVMARVSGTKDEDLSRGPLYGVLIPSDANFYKRNADTMTWSGNGKKYQHLYKSTKEMKAPGLDNRLRAFYNICEDLSTRELKKIGNETIKSLGVEKTATGKKIANNFVNITKGKDKEYTTYMAYRQFIQTVCRKASLNEKHRDMYFNELKRMGFDCMLDENNVGAADYPFIIFGANDKLKKYKSATLGRKNTKDLTSEIVKNRGKITPVD